MLIAFQLCTLHTHRMFTFGFATLIDLLSWVIVLSLGLKVAVTLYLLIIDKVLRDTPGWGAALWWATKITPIAAMPCLIWIALLEGEAQMALIFLALGLFVIISLPLKIRQRRRRINERMSAK
jgi:hypothetical protein